MARKSKYDLLPPFSQALLTVWSAGFYLRLSVEDGDDEEYNSIGNQRKICMAFLQQHEDIQFGGVYSDNGYTGMNYNRPGFQALLADLKAGKINCVIVKDISRFGRHYIMTSEYVERTLPEMGVRLICVNDNYDSANPDSDRDSLLMPFKLIINDTYVKDTSKRIRSSITAKMNRAEYLPSAGSVPYGYQRDPEACTYTIDDEAAPVVKRIYEMRAQRMGFHTIAKQLNREGIPCPGKLRYDRGVTKAAKYQDALWIRGTVKKIANDEVYLGTRVYGRVGRERLGADKKKRPEEEWKKVPNAHPPIIDQALFDRVQEVNRAELERLAGFEPQAAPEEDYRDVLRGKVYCGDCGSRMTAGKRISRKSRKIGPRLPNEVIYDCNAYRDSGRARCSNHYIAEHIIVSALTNFLDEQVRIFSDVEALVSKAQKTVRASDTYRGQLLTIKNKKASVEARQMRYVEDLAQGILERDTYQRLKAGCQQELDELACQEDAVKAACEKERLALSAAEIWIASIRRYQRVQEIDRGLVDALVDKIEVFEDKSIRICVTYEDPLAALAFEGLSMEGGYLSVG